MHRLHAITMTPEQVFQERHMSRCLIEDGARETINLYD
jgi:hypothetical protein